MGGNKSLDSAEFYSKNGEIVKSYSKIFFTITAVNYIPYAKVLSESLKTFMGDCTFYLIVCDKINDKLDINVDFGIISLEDLDDDRLYGMAERYNITEFCTSIKPFVFRYLFEHHPGATVCYIDPDILAVSSFDEVFAEIDGGANLVLTPHVLEPSRHHAAPDRTMLKFGSYNLGFLATRANAETDALMAWWCDRLEHECIIDLSEGIFVDQKWADLFPSLIDRVSVLRHAGYNVAYWNLLQRTVTFNGEAWSVNGQPLRFVHFSGNEMTKAGVFSRHGHYIDYAHLGDLKLLYEHYRELVISAGYFEMAKQRYAFNFDGSSGINLHTPTSTADLLKSRNERVNRPRARFDMVSGRRGEADVMHIGRSETLHVKQIGSWEEYLAWRGKGVANFESQRAIEREVEGPKRDWFDVEATCAMCNNVCPMRVSYMYAHTLPDGTVEPNWREHLDCNCGFVNRIRAAMHAMQTIVAPKKYAKIYVTERVTQLFKWLRIRYPNVVGSEYLGPQCGPGQIVDGIRHEDVCKLSFADKSFDLIMSFDVLEHVEHFERAVFELHRCLKAGGTLLFAAPTQFDAPAIVDRVRVRPDGVYDYVMPPEYHGNPVDEKNGALCFRYLGLDVLGMMKKLGFREAKAIFYWSKDYGYLGRDQVIFKATR